jgi:hypothetical protein
MSSRPLPICCDVHRQPMEMTGCQWGMSLSPPDYEDKYFGRCTREGCRRHFHPEHGYVDVSDDGMDTKRRQSSPCPKGHGSMAIVDFNGEGGPIWRCVHADCR